MSQRTENIKNNFSRSAELYDRYSYIQKEVAKKLLEFIEEGNCKNILDLGCGTGDFTAKLQNKFPEAQITAVDLSGRMLDIAARKKGNENVKFIRADLADLQLETSFDLITGNACLQWVKDIKAVIQNYKRNLSKEGRLIFSVFGPQTYSYLNQFFNEIAENPPKIPAADFKTEHQLYNILHEEFDTVEIRQMYLTKNLNSLKDLLKLIKFTGTKGKGLDRPLGKQKFLRLQKKFMERFGTVKADYQVFLVRCH